MKYMVRLKPAAELTRKDGLRPHPVDRVGPFDTHNTARLWVLKANAILDGLGVKEVFLECLDEPTDFL